MAEEDFLGIKSHLDGRRKVFVREIPPRWQVKSSLVVKSDPDGR